MKADEIVLTFINQTMSIKLATYRNMPISIVRVISVTFKTSTAVIRLSDRGQSVFFPGTAKRKKFLHGSWLEICRNFWGSPSPTLCQKKSFEGMPKEDFLHLTTNINVRGYVTCYWKVW